MSNFGQRVRSYRKQNIGFACFLAWNFISLYGCGIAAGPFIRCSIERVWLVAGLVEVIVAVVCLALIQKHPLSNSKQAGIFAATCAVLGNIGIWLSYLNGAAYFWIFFGIGGVFCGIAMVLMTAIWGSRLTQCNESAIEFSVLASFAVAFALYCVVLPIKLYGVVTLLVASVLPVLSIYFAYRTRKSNPEECGYALSGASSIASGTAVTESATTPKDATSFQDERSTEGATASASTTKSHLYDAGMSLRPGSVLRQLRESLSVFVVVSLLWSLIAFFRIFATPSHPGDRYGHYLIPFFCAFVVTLVLFAVLLRVSSYLNFTLLFRWALPFLLLEFGLMYFDYSNESQRIAAYSANYICMFGMQISYWIAAPKFLRRSGMSAPVLFLGLAIGEGLGIFLGASTGLILFTVFGIESLPATSLFFMAGIFFIVLLLGFNPTWMFNRAHRPDFASEDVPSYSGPESDDDMLSSLFQQEARALARTYSLTGRETEVAVLLLAGRNRPYIRDELVISLNTVHAHARNIFAKCNVHSQQEFMNLARHGDTKADLSFP